MSALTFATEAATGPVLPFILGLPIAGAIAIALLPKGRADVIRLVAIAATVGAAALAVYLLFPFEPEHIGFQFQTDVTWIEAFDVRFHLGIDGISLMLVVLTGLLFALAILGAQPDHDEKAYYAWLLVLEAGCLGAFMALDTLIFFLMFELSIVPLYLLIGGWGHGRRVYAANKFFLYTLLASVFMLVALVVQAVSAHAGPNGGITFDVQKLAESTAIGEGLGRWLFLGFAIAFAVKTPIFPFHTWLPDAHTEAPTAGSVTLAAVVLKLGTFGFLRFAIYLFPEAARFFSPALMVLAIIGIVYGAAVAAMQRNLKRVVAFSSVAHMGFCILGLFSLTTIGIEGSILVMINHGIATGALFLLLGFLYTRRHTYEIAELSGLQKVAPWFAGVFTLVMLASIGLPGLNGFVGELLSLQGAFLANRWYAVVAGTGVILAALYLLWAYQRVFHGETTEPNRLFPDLRTGERLVMVPLIALIVALGVYPKPLLDRIEPAVVELVRHVERRNPGWQEPQPERTVDERVATGAVEVEPETDR
jgi:NADH-quinone oxidoreductase subunit M